MKYHCAEICNILLEQGSGPKQCRKGIPCEGMQRLQSGLLWQPSRCVLVPGGDRFSIFLEFKLLSAQHSAERKACKC